MDKLTVSMSREMWTAYEQWAHRHQPWEDGDHERPAKLKDATLFQLVKPSGQRVNRLWLPTGHIMPPPIRGGARLFDAVDDNLNVAAAAITAYPFTMAIRGRSNSNTVNGRAMSTGDKDADDTSWDLIWAGNVAGDPIRF